MIYTGNSDIGLQKMNLVKLSYEQIYRNRCTKDIAVYYINIDSLNIINSSLGYACGDLVIKEVSKRLDMLQTKDTVITHLFCDEFIIMQMVPDDSYINFFSEKVLSIIQKPLILGEDSIYITASMGVSIFPKHGEDISTLIKKAKLALSYSKGIAKNYYHIYDELEDGDCEYKLRERYSIITNLKNAILKNEFSILYQPVLNVDNNRIVGAEALLRWNSKKLGHVPPSLFIPIAEESNEMISIGEWVLTNVIEQYNNWLEQGYSNLRILINLSGCQLNDFRLINKIENLRSTYPINLSNIELEITESAIIKNFKTATQILDKLKQFGIKISLDDFGSGYSSLNYITNLMIDQIKIDKSYIDEITNTYKKHLIVKTIIDVAHKLGVEVTAEGIEDTTQLQLLKRLKCDRYQGFLFSKPLAIPDFERLLVQQSYNAESDSRFWAYPPKSNSYRTT